MDLRVWLVVFLILAPLTTPIVSAEASTPEIQTKDGDRDTTNEPSVFVTAEIEGDKWVDVGFDSSLEQKYDFPKIFSAVFGCSMGDVNLSRDEEDQLTSFHTNCKTTIQRSSMARSGTINLQPIRDIQSTDPNVNFASLSLWFPQSKFVRCDPAPKRFADRADPPGCVYVEFQFGGCGDSSFWAQLSVTR